MVQTKNGGPPCPKVERLEELMEFLTEEKDSEHFGVTEQGLGQAEKRNAQLQEVVEALDWLHTSLSNRKVYQKKQQIKKKVWLGLAKQLLSPEEQKQVNEQTEKELQEVIANEA